MLVLGWSPGSAQDTVAQPESVFNRYKTHTTCSCMPEHLRNQGKYAKDGYVDLVAGKPKDQRKPKENQRKPKKTKENRKKKRKPPPLAPPFLLAFTKTRL